MMSREADSVSRKEKNNGTDEKGSNPQSSSGLSSWARSRDPRIVRVSRAFGGKDRHSKVCTVRGLRDRRVRLSVPTAIQLYDLQDRLGLNQPSKVVDWLLDAAKHEIDELPPLQMPPGNLINHNLESLLASHQSNKHVAPNGSNSWISDALLRNTKSKDQEPWTRRSHDQENDQCAYVSSNDMISSVHSHSPISGQQFMRWDSSTLSLAQSGSSGNMTQHHEDNHGGFNVLPSGTHHVLLYHQPNMNQSYCPSNNSAEDYVPKQFNFHMLNSSTASENQLSNQLGAHFDLSSSARATSDQK